LRREQRFQGRQRSVAIMKAQKEKDPKVLIALGERLVKVKRELSAADFGIFKYNEPKFRHEAH
jgi:hypothetical protein